MNPDTAIEAAAPIITTLIQRLLPNLNRHDEDDLRQDVTVRLLEVLHRYNPARAKFTTWAFIIIRNRIVDYARQQDRRIRTIDTSAIDVTAPMPAGATDTMPGTECLTDKQRAVYERLCQGKQPAAIARELGLCRESVAQMKRRILTRLQAATLTPAAWRRTTD